MSDSILIPRAIFDEIVEELGNAIDDIDNIRRLQAALVRAKRMMNDCDPDMTPVEHFRNVGKELDKGKPP